MNKLGLLVLAAGMGSRYGSLKQIDGVGPNNEAIIDYSIYDAIRAGFNKVVFVIRENFKKDFIQTFNEKRFGGQVEVEFVFQELNELPAGFHCPQDRVKPWGTNHAVLMARNNLAEMPFATINADDFYGRDAFITIASYLRSVDLRRKGNYAMVAYRLQNTLSENGYVSRGVCEKDEKGNLAKLIERTRIWRETDESIRYEDDMKEKHHLGQDQLVSMNLFGFTPDYFDFSEELFISFLNNNIANENSEFFIPFVVNELIQSKLVSLKVLDTAAHWFGVTYKEDKAMVVDRLQQLHKAGEYPEKLWR